jgi:hypothetical protein
MVRAMSPVLLASAVAFVGVGIAWWNSGFPDWAWYVAVAVLTMGGGAVSIIWCFGTEHEERFLRRHSFALCTGCQYPLSGLGATGVCPECGRAFTREDSQSFWSGYLRCREEMERHGPD